MSFSFSEEEYQILTSLHKQAEEEFKRLKYLQNETRKQFEELTKTSKMYEKWG